MRRVALVGMGIKFMRRFQLGRGDYVTTLCARWR